MSSRSGLIPAVFTGGHPHVSVNAAEQLGTPDLQLYEFQFSHKEVRNMRLNLTKSLGMLLLGIWLIVTGVLTALSVGNPIVHVLLALLAIAAGVFIVLGR